MESKTNIAGEWKPDNSLQMEIYHFWSARGYDGIKGALGKFQISFIKEHTPTGHRMGEVELIYLEQFYHQAQSDMIQKIKKVIDKVANMDIDYKSGNTFSDTLKEKMDLLISESE